MFDLWAFLLQTLTASGVAALLLLLKALFQDKLPPKWQFARLERARADAAAPGRLSWTLCARSLAGPD